MISRAEMRDLVGGWVSARNAETVMGLYDRLSDANADLERGKLLVAIREILEPHGRYGKFISNQPLFSLRTAYRYSGGYEAVSAILPAVVVDEAIAMNLALYGNPEREGLYGRYTKAVKLFPVPRNPTRAQAREWLAKIVHATPKRLVRRITDPAQVKYELFQAFKNRTSALELTPREKKAFMREVVGPMLAYWEIGSMTFAPTEVPAEFVPARTAQLARQARWASAVSA